MKKLLLASAIAALSVSAVQAAPTVYGKAFLTVDLQDGDDNSSFKDSRSQLTSKGSRIGLKGSESLTTNTDLVYKLEYGIDVDADTQQFKSRDTYLGLSNKQYGTLLAGRLKAIDDYIDYANVTKGGVIGGDKVQASVNGPRTNNTFAYFSPEYNGVQFMGMYTLDENDNTDNLGGDAFGVGVKYEPANQPFKAGVSYLRAANYNADSTDMQAIRVSGAYALNNATTLGALYQLTDFSGDEKENAFTVSAQHKIAQTPWTAYGQLDYVDNRKGVKDAERLRATVGGKYAFNKNTTAHVYGAYMKDESAKADADSYGVGAGIEYKF
ncbi:hypothetical protein B0181_03920 [Moraxella caviae]|uniref:Outer membrane porin protein BP0840 n=1 Tax=Moraxella caviae TaxID=34060 RepID=A0A1T0A5S5_9GAMM|nr:porin [Moraxella caviae]OOR91085.1 hypothetical protein B0181_03920 [Moraxella caviae]STZ14219.1 Outer membrane porin protein BP0840 precursor [Moraxella caviae]VEW13155.1 Outer membrane porin protein BP0840 precursor [Moraxella caviae]